MASDERTVYTLNLNAQDLIDIDNDGKIRALTLGSIESVDVMISFPDFSLAKHLSTIISIQLISFTSISLTMEPYPS